MNRKPILAVALILAWIGLVSVAKAQNESWSVVRAANHPAMVYLKTVVHYPNGLVEESGATGFLVHPDGWILTCAHVVPQLTDEAKAKGVTLSTMASVGGRGELGRMVEVIRRDTDKDLALLKLKHESPRPWPTVTVNLDGALGLEQHIYALGFPAANPEGLDGADGIIRGRLRELWVMSVPINPGNSGGLYAVSSGN